MDPSIHIDWPTLLAGLLLGIPLTIVCGFIVNRLQRRIDTALDARTSRQFQKSRAQALNVYSRIKAFREGTRDRYPFYMLLSSAAIICVIISISTFTVLLVRSPFSPELPTTQLFAITAFLLLFLAALLLLVIYSTARNIEQFEEYKTHVEKLWGPIDDKPS